MAEKKEKSDIVKWCLPACLFLGMGVGLLIDKVGAFTLIGLGLGLLITFFISRKNKN